MSARQPLRVRETLDYRQSFSRGHGDRCVRSRCAWAGGRGEIANGLQIGWCCQCLRRCCWQSISYTKYFAACCSSTSRQIVIDSVILVAGPRCFVRRLFTTARCRTIRTLQAKISCFCRSRRKLHCRVARIRSVRYPSGPLLADKHVGSFTSPVQGGRTFCIPLAD